MKVNGWMGDRMNKHMTKIVTAGVAYLSRHLKLGPLREPGLHVLSVGTSAKICRLKRRLRRLARCSNCASCSELTRSLSTNVTWSMSSRDQGLSRCCCWGLGRSRRRRPPGLCCLRRCRHIQRPLTCPERRAYWARSEPGGGRYVSWSVGTGAGLEVGVGAAVVAGRWRRADTPLPPASRSSEG